MESTCIIRVNGNKVKASTDNGAYQLYNEGAVKEYDSWPLKSNTWYNINGDYGLWVLKNLFNCHKGGEIINVIFEK